MSGTIRTEPVLGGLTPLRVFRAAAVAEAITWALLLAGMFLKHVTETTELGVRIFGMLHGVVFVGYCLVAVLVWADQRWTLRHGVLALVAAIPPFATVPFDRYAERRGLLGGTWRSSLDADTRAQRLVGRLLLHPGRALVLGALAVVVLTGLALLVGPPTA
ncbi:DUF3817 domain-containing protein [Nocardioides sp.]|uniref:DUF3817 domain-containing protein n=1 Tax=Nocardioides sp. TaxID=35761 RepID=UPI00273378AB|nr:DUF3817 domain-containing protein [Nocardioides sp.]MDP3892194.1 DUF3817 domain-containing protein [Nocardioides sp.]